MALPEDVSRALGKELAARRKAARLTQPQMAHRSGLRWATTVARIEHNESRCSIPQLVGIAEVLGVPASEILAAAEVRAAKDRAAREKAKREGKRPPGESGLPRALGTDS